MMPGTDGFHLLRNVRNDPSLKDIPVIVLSARAGEEACVEGLEAGADDYLIKPFSSRELISRVKSRLQLTALRFESQQKINSIIESITDAFWAIDCDGKITFANKRAGQILGFSPQALLGREIWDFFIPESSPIFSTTIKSNLSKHTSASFEEFIDFLNSWFEIRAYPYADGLAIYAADITLRKETEKIIRETQLKLEVAFGNSPITLLTTDTGLRITWAYNLPPELSLKGVIGKRPDEFLPPDSIQELMSFLNSVLKKGTGTRGIVHFWLGSRLVTHNITVEPIRDEQGTIIGLTIASMNITEHEQLEQEAIQSASWIEMQHLLMNQREQERLRIAQDLHDGPVQDLLGATLGLHSLEADLEGHPSLSTVRDLREDLQKQIAILRNYAGELRPPALMSFGLVRAIRSHIDQFNRKHPEIMIELDADQRGGLVPMEQRVALYRIYQEAMNNILTR